MLKHVRVAALLSPILLLAGSAAAVTITSTTIETNASITGAGSDPKGPANSGTLLSQVIDPNGAGEGFIGDAAARAAQNVAGDGALAVEGLYANPPGRIVLLGETSWIQTAEITGGSPETLSIALSIAAPRLAFSDFAGVGLGADELVSSYVIELLLDGNPIFGSTATFRGGRGSSLLEETGTDLGGTFFDSGSLLGYDFDPLVTSVGLGTFDPGETLTVEYRMRVLVDTPQFETGGSASIGDPTDLSGPDVTQVRLVPEPSTGALVALALLGLGVARRR